MNPYYYLYYKIYKFTSKLGNWQVAESAVYGMTLLLMINAIIIKTVIFKYLNINNEINHIYVIGFFSGLFFFFNIFLFTTKDKYLLIIKKYENENKIKKQIGNIIVILYVVLTFISIFIV